MADHIETIVDEAMRLLRAKRESGIGPLWATFAVDAANELEWSAHYQSLALHHCGCFLADRNDLVDRMRKQWHGFEDKATVADTAPVLQDMAREYLREMLYNDDLPHDAVDKFVATYSFALPFDTRETPQGD
jgi:hypothetical protein